MRRCGILKPNLLNDIGKRQKKPVGTATIKYVLFRNFNFLRDMISRVIALVREQKEIRIVGE